MSTNQNSHRINYREQFSASERQGWNMSAWFHSCDRIGRAANTHTQHALGTISELNSTISPDMKNLCGKTALCTNTYHRNCKASTITQQISVCNWSFNMFPRALDLMGTMDCRLEDLFAAEDPSTQVSIGKLSSSVTWHSISKVQPAKISHSDSVGIQLHTPRLLCFRLQQKPIKPLKEVQVDGLIPIQGFSSGVASIIKCRQHGFSLGKVNV